MVPSSATSWRRWCTPAVVWVAFATLFALISAVITIRFMNAHLPLSPVDEFQYIDAVDKARHWDVVLTGDKSDQYARSLMACRGAGFSSQAQKFGLCGQDTPDFLTIVQGYTTADVHPPVYFFLTAWLSWPLQRLGGMELITAARLTGALWLWAGMLAMAWALRRLGGGWGLAFAMPVAIAAAPAFRLTNAYVTPDALNLLAGTLILAAMILYARGEWGIWPFIGISALFVCVKFQNVFVVIAALVFLVWFWITMLVRRWRQQDLYDQRVPRVREVVLLAALPLAASAVWMVIRALTVVEVVDRPPLDPPASLDLGKVLYTLDDAYQVVLAGTGGQGVESSWSVLPYVLIMIMVAGTVATALFDVPTDVAERSFARAALLSATAVGPMTILMFALMNGTQIDVLGRYVMVLVPLLTLPLARRVQGRVAQGLLVALALWAGHYAAYYSFVN